MGFCPACGTPCPVCSGKTDEFNLLVFPEDVRAMINTVLDKMGLNNPTHQAILVKGLFPYKDKPLTIMAAGREYMSHQSAPANVQYFVAMVKNKAIAKKKRLSALPPLIGEDDDD